MKVIKNALEEANKAVFEPTPVSVSMVEGAIGRSLTEISLLYENVNSRIYKVVDCNDTTLVIKQSRTLSFDEVLAEFSALQSLGDLEIDGFGVPRTFALLPECYAYIMGLARGEQLARLLGDRNTAIKTPQVCKRVGSIIAELHMAWCYRESAVLKIGDILDDIRIAPSRLKKRDNEILCWVATRLEEYIVPYGVPYLDLDPLNIFISDHTVCLIDPPESTASYPLFWDLATFTVGVRKAFWKKNPLSIFMHSAIDKNLEAFYCGYFETAKEYDDTFESTLLMRLLTLQRVHQLIVFQKAGIKRVGLLTIAGVKHFMSCVLLEFEKHKIMRTMGAMMGEIENRFG